MIDVVVVSCDLTNSLYFLSPNDLDLKLNDEVLFEDSDDYLIGKVVKLNYKEKKENLDLPLDNIVRICTKEDYKKYNKNIISADKALVSAKKYAEELELDMNFVDCYYYLDRSKLIFSFISETRVDFRDLAKKLASVYKTRIELRQIGIRDKAKKIGGIGPCGLFLCCNIFLSEFNSVSINMAKNQNLALNPTKINGLCGRLYCCLGYENDLYTELRKELPEVGNIVKTPSGKGKVVSIDILKKTYKVELSENNIIEMSC